MVSTTGRNRTFILGLCDGRLSNQLHCKLLHQGQEDRSGARRWPSTPPAFPAGGRDFTGSNGDPSSPDSLHYLSPTGVNEYLGGRSGAVWFRTMTRKQPCCSSSLLPADAVHTRLVVLSLPLSPFCLSSHRDKLFPAFGFGA